MKIAFIISRFPSLSETFILNQIVGLIELGHDVYILTRNPGDFTVIHETIHEYKLLKKAFLLDMKPSHMTQMNKWFGHKIAYSVLKAYIYFKTYLHLKHFNRKLPKQFDIIHGQFGTQGQYALALKKNGLIAGKVVTSFRGIDISAHLKKHGNDCYRGLFEEGDLFLPSCNHFTSILSNIGCPLEKTHVVYSGIDCSLFQSTGNSKQLPSKIRILSIGRLVPKKGFEYAIEAITLLRKMHPQLNIDYTIVGKGPLKERLLECIRAHKLEDIVHLVGAKSKQEILEAYKENDLVIVPSITPEDGDIEGAANVPKEAGAMELPVIATYHGGLPEVVINNQTGFLVNEKNSEEIATAIASIVRDPSLGKALGKAARTHIFSKFEIKMLNQKLIQLYQATCSN